MKVDRIRCQVAACPENLGDGREWSSYLINDSNLFFDQVTLTTFGHEWADFGSTVNSDEQVQEVAAGSHVRIWRDNDEELNVWLILVIQAIGRKATLLFEFPKLYRRKENLPLVPALSRRGCLIAASE